MGTPTTQYAKSGDASIAYQVVGDGPLDVVLVLGFATHLELQWEMPPSALFFERISSFSRLILFDKRGTGLSDPVNEVPTLEQRIDDVRAVMDAAGSERAALFGVSEGGPMSVLFAATHPERVGALVLHGAMGRTTEAPDYPWASPAEALRESVAEFIAPYWGQDAEGMLELFAPSFAGDPEARAMTERLERSAASPAMVQAIFEMFTDIVGSTERAAEIGDARWRELLSAHQAEVRSELTRFRGREVKTLGDGSLATFDGPARAIRCGQGIAQAARSSGLEVRIGLHAGEVELMGEDVGGIAVHIAARVGALAAPGEVLVSSTVKDLVAGSGITFEDQGTKRLKGISDEWRLYAAGP